MKIHHQCAGGVVYYRDDRSIYIAVLYTSRSECVLPKGHIEGAEGALGAAKREIREEIGLAGLLTNGGYLGETNYKFADHADNSQHTKNVQWFLFSAISLETLTAQKHEGIEAAEWLEVSVALERLTYQDSKDIVRKALVLVE